MAGSICHDGDLSDRGDDSRDRQRLIGGELFRGAAPARLYLDGQVAEGFVLPEKAFQLGYEPQGMCVLYPFYVDHVAMLGHGRQYPAAGRTIPVPPGGMVKEGGDAVECCTGTGCGYVAALIREVQMLGLD